MKKFKRKRDNRMRDYMVWLPALIVLLVISGCGGGSHTVDIQQKDAAQETIVLIAKSRYGDYWNTVKMGAEAAAKEFGVKLTFDGPENEGDVKSQAELVRQYQAYGMDALILAANDYNELAASVNAVNSAGVPVIAVDSEVHSDAVRSFIGIDNLEAGRQAAAKMRTLTGSKGRFAVLSSYPAARNAEQRRQGILDEWAISPELTVAETLYCGSAAGVCQLRARDVMQSGKVDGILTLSAEASIGAAAEIQKEGLAGQVKLIAFENTQEELGWLQEGVIQATLISNPFSMGYLSVKTAVQAANRQKVEKRILTETKVIDSTNMFWSDNQKMLFPFVQ